MDNLVLKMEPRTVTRKKVRQLRSQGVLPGVVFGKGMESIPVQVIGRDFQKIYKKAGGTSILKAELSGKTYSVLVSRVERDRTSPDIVHIDFKKVDLKEKVTVEVPLVIAGVSPLVDNGKGSISQEATTIMVRCLPGDIPSSIEVDVTSIVSADDVMHAKKLVLPDGVGFAGESEKEKVVVIASPIRTAVVEEEEIEEIETEGEPTP